jgi:hypothetical protein
MTKLRINPSGRFAKATDFAANVANGRLLSSVQLPGGEYELTWVDPPSGGGQLAPSVNHIVNVQIGGSDVTGDGTESKPFASINHACALIRSFANASSTNRYAVRVGPGRFTEALVLSDWTYIVGDSIEGTRVTFTSLTLGAEWTANVDHRSGFQHMTVSGAPTVDFAAVSSNQGKLRWDSVVFNDRFTYTAFSAINQVEACSCKFLAGWTQNGINFACLNCSGINGGDVVMNATTVNAIAAVFGSGLDGGLTINATGGTVGLVEMSAGAFEGLLTLNGANASIAATSNPLAFPGGVTLLGGAADPRKNLTGAKGGNAALASVCTQLAATGAFKDSTT